MMNERRNISKQFAYSVQKSTDHHSESKSYFTTEDVYQIYVGSILGKWLQEVDWLDIVNP